jgi:hypothetical protein
MPATAAQTTRYSRNGLMIVIPPESATTRGRSVTVYTTPVMNSKTNTASTDP